MNKNRYYEPKTGHVYHWLVTDNYPFGAMFLEHETNGNIARTVWAKKTPSQYHGSIAEQAHAIKLLGLKPLPSDEWRTDKPKVKCFYKTDRKGTFGKWIYFDGNDWNVPCLEDDSIEDVEGNCFFPVGYAKLRYYLYWPEWARVPPPVGYFEQ
jgi:hypothetical protein